MRYINEYGPQVENDMSLMSTHRCQLFRSVTQWKSFDGKQQGARHLLVIRVRIPSFRFYGGCTTTVTVIQRDKVKG